LMVEFPIDFLLLKKQARSLPLVFAILAGNAATTLLNAFLEQTLAPGKWY